MGEPTILVLPTLSALGCLANFPVSFELLIALRLVAPLPPRGATRRWGEIPKERLQGLQLRRKRKSSVASRAIPDGVGGRRYLGIVLARTINAVVEAAAIAGNPKTALINQSAAGGRRRLISRCTVVFPRWLARIAEEVGVPLGDSRLAILFKVRGGSQIPLRECVTIQARGIDLAIGHGMLSSWGWPARSGSAAAANGPGVRGFLLRALST
jgi:hypothetical protein